MENVFSLGEEDNEAKKQRNKLLILLDLPRWKWKKNAGLFGDKGLLGFILNKRKTLHPAENRGMAPTGYTA